MDIHKKIKDIPELPGVYFFKDAQGKILYIGKAANLKKRLQAYLGRFLSSKAQSMLSQAKDIEYIVTAGQIEAQIKEAALIKEKLPKYNIALRDDKSFPLLFISEEKFPLVNICRKKKPTSEKGTYFGPYTNAKLLRQALKAIRRIFAFRSCKILPKRPCLYYRLALCPAPCLGKISSKAYQENIENIKLFFQGKQERLIEKLSRQMQNLAARQKYEEAAIIRDQIFALSSFSKSGWIEAKYAQALKELKNILHLKKNPLRIEALDISNIFGKEACGSLVSFWQGKPDKNNYRRFKIKEVSGIDDYAMLREIIRRRYTRLKQERKTLPDLILIDGGRQHLSVARAQLKELGLNIPLLSLAKQQEHIYTEDRKEPLCLSRDSALLELLQRIRDEAHRFALSYHHVLRKKTIY